MMINFVLTAPGIFNLMKYLKTMIWDYVKSCKNHDYCEIIMPEKLKKVSNQDTYDYEQVPTNMLKYFPGTGSLYQPVTAFYDFETLKKQMCYQN